jgi:hypothetical protein
MEWLVIVAVVVFLTGIGIVAIQAIRHANKS